MNQSNSTNETTTTGAGFTRRAIIKGAVATGTAAILGEWGHTAASALSPRPVPTPVVREYWIQADSFERNIVSSKQDNIFGRIWNANDCTYWAVGYRAYTPNWHQPLVGSAEVGDNSGIPGPTIRGHVGDQIVIHFRNNDIHYGFPHSMHLHGLHYTPENDGAWMSFAGNAPGTAVELGQTYTYRYKVMPNSVGTWVYHDHSVPQAIGGGAPVMDIGTELGLFGLIAIEDSATSAVDHEFILYFHQLYATDIPTLAQDFACFNGYAFSPNTPSFHAKVGDRVRWRIGALGQDFYVFHLHGHRWLVNGECADTAVLGPSTTATLEYVEDNPGNWYYHCCNPEHLVAGMVGQYTVTA